MANFKQPFGKPDSVKRTNDDDSDTPQQKKFEAATGKDSDNAVGDVPKKPESTTPTVSGVSTPSGTNKELWAQAEAAVVNMSGGFSGIGPEGRKAQIQAQYDQMVANDKQTKEWAGDGEILGDVGKK